MCIRRVKTLRMMSSDDITANCICDTCTRTETLDIIHFSKSAGLSYNVYIHSHYVSKFQIFNCKLFSFCAHQSPT